MVLSESEKKAYKLLKRANSKTPLTRLDIKTFLNIGDRAAREIIGSLRDKGIRVINNEGYWIARTDKQYKDWVSQYSAYAYTILHRIRKMNQYTEGQIGILQDNE